MVSDDTIKRGACTEIYFERMEETLLADRINPHVVMEVTAAALPDTWAVSCGLPSH
jgi:nicotinate phosphoribosyltransferase